MNRCLIIAAAIWLPIAVVPCQTQTGGGKSITLTSGLDQHTVPAGHIWKLEGTPPWRSESGIGTADLCIDGEIRVGKDQDLTLYGHFDISFNRTQTFPIWILAGAKVSVGDSRQKIVVTDLLLEPWSKPVPPLDSLASLARHVGEHPCKTGLIGAPVLQTALRSILADDYGEYLEHIGMSGCSAVEWRGKWLFMDVSQLHVGGYTSFIFVNPAIQQVYLLWVPGSVTDKKCKVYGPEPVPVDIAKVIVDELNRAWGHVASFSWRDRGIVFGPPIQKVGKYLDTAFWGGRRSVG